MYSFSCRLQRKKLHKKSSIYKKILNFPRKRLDISFNLYYNIMWQIKEVFFARPKIDRVRGASFFAVLDECFRKF